VVEGVGFSASLDKAKGWRVIAGYALPSVGLERVLLVVWDSVVIDIWVVWVGVVEIVVVGLLSVDRLLRELFSGVYMVDADFWRGHVFGGCLGSGGPGSFFIASLFSAFRAYVEGVYRVCHSAEIGCHGLLRDRGWA